MQRQNVGEWL